MLILVSASMFRSGPSVSIQTRNSRWPRRLGWATFTIDQGQTQIVSIHLVGACDVLSVAIAVWFSRSRHGFPASVRHSAGCAAPAGALAASRSSTAEVEVDNGLHRGSVASNYLHPRGSHVAHLWRPANRLCHTAASPTSSTSSSSSTSWPTHRRRTAPAADTKQSNHLLPPVPPPHPPPPLPPLPPPLLPPPPPPPQPARPPRPPCSRPHRRTTRSRRGGRSTSTASCRARRRQPRGSAATRRTSRRSARSRRSRASGATTPTCSRRIKYRAI